MDPVTPRARPAHHVARTLQTLVTGLRCKAAHRGTAVTRHDAEETPFVVAQKALHRANDVFHLPPGRTVDCTCQESVPGRVKRVGRHGAALPRSG